MNDTTKNWRTILTCVEPKPSFNRFQLEVLYIRLKNCKSISTLVLQSWSSAETIQIHRIKEMLLQFKTLWSQSCTELREATVLPVKLNLIEGTRPVWKSVRRLIKEGNEATETHIGNLVDFLLRSAAKPINYDEELQRRNSELALFELISNAEAICRSISASASAFSTPVLCQHRI